MEQTKQKLKTESSDLAEVWQDVVSKRHLAVSVILGIVLSMGGYVLGLWLLHAGNPGIKADLAKGYALFFGVGGSLLAALIACICFKPKRIITESVVEESQFLEALSEQNISVQDELAALKALPPEIRRELDDVQVYDQFVKILETEQQRLQTGR